MMEDDAHSVWLYLSCGLVRIGQSELDAWASHPKQTIQVAVFDSSDGVSSHRFTGGYSPLVAKSADGKLWFVQSGGVSVIDPHHLAFNKLPPPVHIEQITADDKTYDATNGLAPAAARPRSSDRLHGAEPVAPEKVRFRYKLEGQNRNWHEVVNDRAGAVHEPRLRALTASASSRATTAACGTKRARRWISRFRRRSTRRAGSGRSRWPARSRRCGWRINSASGKWRAQFSGGWTSASANARASPGTCTTRCFRASTDLLLRFPDRVVPAAGTSGRRERETG